MSAILLVIDDDEASCQLVTVIFEAEGLTVVSARNGQAGLEAAANIRPDGALVDLHMPGLSGFEVLEQFKADMPAMPAIMLTGSMDVKNAVRAMHLGAF